MEKVYTKSIRNVALLGHSGGGKTSLAESMLYISRLTDRLGNIADGNTVCDYDPEETKRGYSISAATVPKHRSYCGRNGITSFNLFGIVIAYRISFCNITKTVGKPRNIKH